jgi:predicted metal-dependent hydrolase
MPTFAAEDQARAFLTQKEGWLRKNLANQHAPVKIVPDASVRIEGDLYRIKATKGPRVSVEGDTLFVPGPEAQMGARLKSYLKTLARDRLVSASDFYAHKLGREYSRITMRDTRSRWGSCSSQGALNYSFRLIMAPAEVLRYVAAHEVAHLEEMNHSAAFWRIVEDLYGDYTSARSWLSNEGGALHRVVFEA